MKHVIYKDGVPDGVLAWPNKHLGAVPLPDDHKDVQDYMAAKEARQVASASAMKVNNICLEALKIALIDGVSLPNCTEDVKAKVAEIIVEEEKKIVIVPLIK